MSVLNLLSPAILLALGLTAHRAWSQPFEMGSAFPTIVLPAADDDRPMSVAGYRGGKLLLHLFASW